MTIYLHCKFIVSIKLEPKLRDFLSTSSVKFKEIACFCFIFFFFYLIKFEFVHFARALALI